MMHFPLVFSLLSNFFSQTLFQFNRNSAVIAFCRFPFASLPLHLNFTMSDVPIKICLQKFTLVL